MVVSSSLVLSDSCAFRKSGSVMGNSSISLVSYHHPNRSRVAVTPFCFSFNSFEFFVPLRVRGAFDAVGGWAVLLVQPLTVDFE